MGISVVLDKWRKIAKIVISRLLYTRIQKKTKYQIYSRPIRSMHTLVSLSVLFNVLVKIKAIFILITIGM